MPLMTTETLYPILKGTTLSRRRPTYAINHVVIIFPVALFVARENRTLSGSGYTGTGIGENEGKNFDCFSETHFIS